MFTANSIKLNRPGFFLIQISRYQLGRYILSCVVFYHLANDCPPPLPIQILYLILTDFLSLV
jgi:hypothetical protein